MDDHHAIVFKHSGGVSPAAPLLVLAVAAIAAALLGFAYGYAIHWIPLIYLNALVAVGYGFAFGFIAEGMAKRGRCRSPVIGGALGLAAGVLGWYGGWVGYVHAISEDGWIAVMPGEMWLAWNVLFENNIWGFGSSGGEVSGWPLVGVWAIECGIIVGIPAVMAYKGLASTPYCEHHGVWLEDETPIDTMSAIAERDDIAKIRSGDLAPLATLKPRFKGAPGWCRLVLKSCAGCDCTYTLRVANVKQVKNKEGKLEEQVEELSGDLVIDGRLHELLKGFAQVEPVAPPRSEAPADTVEATADEEEAAQDQAPA